MAAGQAEEARAVFRPAEAVERGKRARWWRRCGSARRGFRYFDAKGVPVVDPAKLERIRALVIPPAWTEVRIAPSPRSSLQVVGLDTLGRLQYRYHPDFVACQQRKKYAKIERFGLALPALRRRTNADIALAGWPREKTLAVIVRLINDLYFRVGSEASVKQYRTFGITTLRNRHLEIGENGELCFRFVGKRHIQHRQILVDAELADLMRELKALGGARLFHFRDENGKSHAVTPREVNAYIKAATGAEFSAKDFRTWGGTLLAAVALAERGVAETERERKHRIVEATRIVAERLGNTPAVCRNSYIHPIVFTRYEEGITLSDFQKRAERSIRRYQPEYEVEELALLKLFRAENDCKT